MDDDKADGFVKDDLLSAALSASGLDEFLSFSLPQTDHESGILDTVDEDIRQSQPIMMDASCVPAPVTTAESFQPVTTTHFYEPKQSTSSNSLSLTRSRNIAVTSLTDSTKAYPAGTRLAKIGDKTVAIKPNQRLIVFRRGGGSQPRLLTSAPASQSTSPVNSGRSSPASTTGVTMVSSVSPIARGRMPQAPRLVRGGSSNSLSSAAASMRPMHHNTAPIVHTRNMRGGHTMSSRAHVTRVKVPPPVPHVIKRPRLMGTGGHSVSLFGQPRQQLAMTSVDSLQHQYGTRIVRNSPLTVTVNPRVTQHQSLLNVSPGSTYRKHPIPSGTTVRVTRADTGWLKLATIETPTGSSTGGNAIRIVCSPDQRPSSMSLAHVSPNSPSPPGNNSLQANASWSPRDPLKPTPKTSGIRPTYVMSSPAQARTTSTVYRLQNTPVAFNSTPTTAMYKSKQPLPVTPVAGSSAAVAAKPPPLSNALPANAEDDLNEEEEAKLGYADTYATYVPAKLRSGLAHPDPVVETSSLNSVQPPDIEYGVSIPEQVIDSGCISALQLESVIYACQQHEKILPSGERAGFLVGDGAGVGKGRIIASIIHENYLCGRKRAVWFSVSNDLKFDAERDLQDVGASRISVHALNKFKYAKISGKENGSVKRGVLFATYSSLIGECRSARGKYKTRLKQLLQWCGQTFDGVIIFDECHRAKNLQPSVGGKASKTGQAVLELQKCLPHARIVYASATGATEPRNMAYMSRLGLWGPGQPFPAFSDFLNVVEKRGVGAMEIVAIDMKQRGGYLARQLSFKGVSFRVEPVALSEDFVRLYDESAKLWLEVRRQFQLAIELADVDRNQNKAIWSQFWASHQRFFKYLCIGAKVSACVRLAREAVKNGKCVVIGLQSTGEARTLETLEEQGGELTEFVSTTKAVLMSLVDKHFPTGKRDGLYSADLFSSTAMSAPGPSKRKLGHQSGQPSKRARRGSGAEQPQQSDTDSDAGSSARRSDNSEHSEQSDDQSSGNSDTTTDEDTDNEQNDNSKQDWFEKLFAEAQSSSDESEPDEPDEAQPKQPATHDDDFNPFDDDDDEYWRSKQQITLASPDKPSTSQQKPKKKTKSVSKAAAAAKNNWLPQMDVDDFLGKQDKQEHEDLLACGAGGELAFNKIAVMKAELMAQIERLGDQLPANTLDQLIDELGGSDAVAEMTGRRGRVVCGEGGDVRYEPRQLGDVSLEMLNLAEKERFMNGNKLIAVISEAASSGISLQADRRVANQRRRVHITLELPWSADKAIQQFGRSHRSNQVNAPEYVFLISELAGEQRFASIVAKRLESLGALTHGDRRATETRDLSQFNLDTKYGRAALESLMQSIIGKAPTVVRTPATYTAGDFLPDMRRYLEGVGVLLCDKRGVYAPDKDANNMSKFLNRLLGLPVLVQNTLFHYFLDTLNELTNQAKRDGRYDLGILDLGMSGDSVHPTETRVFTASNRGMQYSVQLHSVMVERGLSWSDALDAAKAHTGINDGFYFSNSSAVGRPSVALICGTGKKQLESGERLFSVSRPNTGRNARLETWAELSKRFRRVSCDAAQPVWQHQYESSASKCQHMCQYGSCRLEATGHSCDIGKRTRHYHILSGNVLAVWPTVEEVLSSTAGKRQSRMQVIRARTDSDAKLVGLVIPNRSMAALTHKLAESTHTNYTL